MTPEAFIRKWRDVQTKERAAAQEHFIACAGCSANRRPTRLTPTPPVFE
jgi:hypothetical protein